MLLYKCKDLKVLETRAYFSACSHPNKRQNNGNANQRLQYANLEIEEHLQKYETIRNTFKIYLHVNVSTAII